MQSYDGTSIYIYPSINYLSIYLSISVSWILNCLLGFYVNISIWYLEIKMYNVSLLRFLFCHGLLASRYIYIY